MVKYYYNNCKTNTKLKSKLYYDLWLLFLLNYGRNTDGIICKIEAHVILQIYCKIYIFQGEKCKKGCPKINILHNQEPPAKKPEEEMLLLRTTRQITPTNDMKHSLEVEFKSPRNYIPLPEPGPTPPIIIPKQPVILKKLENNMGKGKKSTNKGRNKKK